MHPQLFPISCIFVAIVALIRLPASFAQGNEQYPNCSQLFQCGNIQGIGYPFWGGNRSQSCGHPSFQLDCTGEAPVLTIETRPYRVRSIDNATYVLTVARQEFWNDSCPQYLYNATLDTEHFSYAADTNDLALYYGCTALTLNNTIQNQFSCLANGTVGTFVNLEVLNSQCPAPLRFFIFDRSSLEFGPNFANPYLFYNCTTSFPGNYSDYPLTRAFSNSTYDSFTYLLTGGDSVNGAAITLLLVSHAAPVEIEGGQNGQIEESKDYAKLLTNGFTLEWSGTSCAECVNSGGNCESSDGNLVCFCPDGPH
ncbi:hypothetical protein RHGRI_023292 [Rhododendron griersonianum]|uniref:non-specific serine/threonine protein kinase n=1 Tax=Rhododendron griersonianum TaxID=479676 RepID=A0AAV6J6T9_9ERIC|nr:hypothetical protein RHGRI_023292 [Rhododendron griersonianum]